MVPVNNYLFLLARAKNQPKILKKKNQLIRKINNIFLITVKTISYIKLGTNQNLKKLLLYTQQFKLKNI